MSQQFIPLSVPNFSGNEKQYVNEAVISEWVSTGGSKVSEFEEKIAEYTHMPRAVACNSGTSGLHLAMLMAGVGRGDEVLAPALTFIAAVNPIRYAGAEPVFIGWREPVPVPGAGRGVACRQHRTAGRQMREQAHGRARESASGGACVRQYGQYARAGGAVPEVRPGPH